MTINAAWAIAMMNAGTHLAMTISSGDEGDTNN